MDDSQNFVFMGTVKRNSASTSTGKSIGRNLRSHSEKTSPHLIQDDISVFSDESVEIWCESLDRRQSKSISDLRLDSVDLVIDGILNF